ncbi:MAG: S-methyl-5-thioribose-1-phosphate isomerase [Planctomycetaceae bacterium]|nr:S-methyl-5-thioribose-1-phosphate isomerase [Planctomycetaceae bacterium]
MTELTIPRTLRWKSGSGGCLELIDQRRLPGELKYIQCTTCAELFDAIVTLAVRGAPAIGVAAAFGVCLGLRTLADNASATEALENIEQTCRYLASSRPTAINLFRALERMQKKAQQLSYTMPNLTTASFKQALLAEAQAIEREDQDMCLAIGRCGQSLIPDGGAILTHCNAGALATAGIGTALAPMYTAHRAGKRFRVYVDETRPLLQGARLTAWELTHAGIEAILICDNMAASLMQKGQVSAVITGADRIAANGDTANKIGTLGLSIIAKFYDVGFYAAAPSTTFDMTIASGDQIPIEQRSADEVRLIQGVCVSPKEIAAVNPAFDVTPHENITAFITDRGLFGPGEIGRQGL